ncbi:MAG: DUF29 domain-containing protein [Endozoicomonas sp.]|uniref:DUF29 domain-containing protein n=1 Tax=Endozoicomonas sp. TaxID=1892382 RepID=UPI003D9B7BA1
MADYDKDFYAWLNHQADLLENGQLNGLDLDNLIEEVDCMGKRHLHKLESHVTLLLMHLLKWQYQPSKRQYGHSWETSIRVHRQQAWEVIEKHPSLSGKIMELYEENYRQAVKLASIETRIEEDSFPLECPWTFDQVMNEDWLPAEST